MAIIKRSSSKTQHKSPSKPAPKPAESKKPETSAAKLKEEREAKKPGASPRTDETEKPEKNDVKQVDESKEPDKLEEGSKTPEEGKEPKDEFSESEELKKEEEENQQMREEIEGLKDALASLYDMMGSEDDKKDEKPESLGGCCGKSQGSKKTGEDDSEKDWNSILTAGIAAVKAQNLGGNLTLLNGGQGGQTGQNAPPKPAGMAALAARGGKPSASQGGDPRTKLASDYQKAKTANAQLRPEVENEVRNLLGMPPLQGQNQAQAGAPQNQGLAMAAGF